LYIVVNCVAVFLYFLLSLNGGVFASPTRSDARGDRARRRKKKKKEEIRRRQQKKRMADAAAGNAVWREGGTHLVRLRTGVTLAVEVVTPAIATTTTAVAADRVVVLVHGLAQQRSVWRETAEHLVRRLGCTCVLPDLRGHGDSTGSATTLPHAVSSFRAASAAGLSDDRDVAQRYRLMQLADDLAALAPVR